MEWLNDAFDRRFNHFNGGSNGLESWRFFLHSILEETTTTVDQKYDNEFPIHVTNKPYKLQQHSSL